MFEFVYIQPLRTILLLTLVLLAAWFLLAYRFRRPCRVLSRIGLPLAVLLILYMTVFSRSPGDYELILRPFYRLSPEAYNNESVRTMLMNAFLFLPLGLTMPLALPEGWKHSWLIAVLFGLCLSTLVETMQYVLHLGTCEVDDVIMNTFGTFVGCIPCYCARFLSKKKNNCSNTGQDQV